MIDSELVAIFCIAFSESSLARSFQEWALEGNILKIICPKSFWTNQKQFSRTALEITNSFFLILV